MAPTPHARDPRPTSSTPTSRPLKSQTSDNEPQYDGKGYTFRSLKSIKQSNFDADNAATLNVFSVAKNGQPGTMSGDGEWTSSVFLVSPKEHGLSLDFRLTFTQARAQRHVFYVTD